MTIEAAPGATPSVNGDLVNRASWLTVRGISVSGVLDLAEGTAANNVVFDRMHATNFLIAGHDMTFARNTFARNVVYDLQVQNFTGSYGGAPSNVTIENNWFVGPVEWLPLDTTWDRQPNVQLDCRPGACAYTNWLVRFNSFTSGVDFQFDGNNALTNVRAVGNVGGGSNCSGAIYEYNVWGDGTCGATDKRAAPAYLSSSIGSPDFHLSGGTAVDEVPGLDADQRIANDHDGNPRPLGAARDAGADELR